VNITKGEAFYGEVDILGKLYVTGYDPIKDASDGPLAASTCQTGVLKNHQEWEPSMSEITTIGLDIAKHVFQVHGIDAQGTTVLRKRLRRGQVLAFFSRIPRCVVGLEACATAHYWARELGALGHEVRLMLRRNT
jgi:hypothetical protein